jgi:hypothetical protein
MTVSKYPDNISLMPVCGHFNGKIHFSTAAHVSPMLPNVCVSQLCDLTLSALFLFRLAANSSHQQ